MLYELIEIRRGKEKVVMVDELPKVNARLKTLRQSNRGNNRGNPAGFVIRPAPEEGDKYRAPKKNRY